MISTWFDAFFKKKEQMQEGQAISHDSSTKCPKSEAVYRKIPEVGGRQQGRAACLHERPRLIWLAIRGRRMLDTPACSTDVLSITLQTDVKEKMMETSWANSFIFWDLWHLVSVQ